LAWVVVAAALLLLADSITRYLSGQGSLWDVAWAALSCIPGTKGLTTLAALKNAYRHGGLGEAGAHVLAAARAAVNEMTRSLRSIWSARPRGHVAILDGRGSWVGEGGLRLSGEDAAMVKSFAGDAIRAEPRISRMMLGLVNDLPTARLVGFDARLKSFDSLARKTATELQLEPSTARVALGHIKDSIRYTVETPSDNFAVISAQLVERLVDEGLESIQFKNSFGGLEYQGVNTTWRDPSTGQTFEVQFHTPESFVAKSVTHSLYEELRLPNADPARSAEIKAMQREVFHGVQRPPGVEQVALPDRGRVVPETAYVPDESIGEYGRKLLQAVGYIGATKPAAENRMEMAR
jgi:hypothetical protein